MPHMLFGKSRSKDFTSLGRKSCSFLKGFSDLPAFTIRQWADFVFQCCGGESYQLTDKNVLCCDGVLHRDQPAGSRCLGNSTYYSYNYTLCNRHAHLPAGQQCCGEKTFDPLDKICCQGHRYVHFNWELLTWTDSAYLFSTAMVIICCTWRLKVLRSICIRFTGLLQIISCGYIAF